MSYENLILYNAVIPSYKKPDKEKSKGKKTGKGLSFGNFMSQMKHLKGNER